MGIPNLGSSDGQIGNFEGPCPDGWSDYLQAQGRFILGAGNG